MKCDSKVELARRLTQSPNEDAEAVAGALSSLTDAELKSFGLKAFQINMLSVLGELRPAQQIARLARAATINRRLFEWSYRFQYLRRLAAGDKRPHLGNLPIAKIQGLLRRGRGLVIVSFHQGHFRHLASDLTLAGIPVCMLLAADSFEQFTAEAAALPERVIPGLTAANVEEVQGSLKFAKVLVGGGCIYAMIDGNTGLDGTRGSTHRTVVDILGCKVRVKTGLIRMAALRGAPILPLFAHTIDGEPKCHTAAVIDPAGPLSGEDAQRFAEETIRRLYAHFGENLLAFSDQWSGCGRFHLWRVPDTPLADREPCGQRVITDIEAGGTATVDSRRIVDLSHDGDIVWVDAKTLRCYRLESEMSELIGRLSGRSGVDRAWLGRHGGTERSRMWAVIRELATRGAIQSYGVEVVGAESVGLS